MDALLRRRQMMMAGGSPMLPVFYDYLYFDGTAYIVTDYVIPASASIRIPLGKETSKAQQQVFQAGSSSAGRIGMIYNSNSSSTNRRLEVYYDSKSAIKSDRNFAWSYQTYAFFMTPLGYGIGNNYYTYTKGSYHPSTALYLGGWGTSRIPYTGRMGIIRIYGSDAQNVSSSADFDNYTPIATFRPCTYNGEAGFWYVEGNKFFGNSGSAGTLTASNE